MTSAVTIILLIAVWFAQGERKENPMPVTSPRVSSDRRQVAREGLVETRLRLLEDMKMADPDNYGFKVPVEFYGKVLDQHDNPVAGAKIQISLNTIFEILNRDLFTGADGTFSLSGVSGKFLSVNVFGLDGYTGVQATKFGDYNYAEPGEHNFHVPNPNKPVVFRLWKYDEPEPLHRWILTSEVKPDGAPKWFDLDRGTVGGASLGICIVDELPGNNDEERHAIKVMAGDGCALVATNDNAMFIAPAKIDQNEISTVHKAKNGYYNSGPGIFRFYFRTAQGKYAAVNAEVSAGSDGAKLEIYQNPSGSRNLEYDPRLEIK